MSSKLFIMVFLFLTMRASLVAEPFDPQDDTLVVEQLYAQKVPPALREIRQLRRELLGHPHDLDLALRLGGDYLGLARAEGDMRYAGYAQMVLTPWWALAKPPTDVLLLRASIRQYNHDFNGALADLAEVARRDPSNTQAFLTQAFVLQAQGKYSEAEKSCRNLGRTLSAELVCISSVRSFTDQASQSYEQLKRALESGIYRTPEEKFWVSGMLADMAARQGRFADADQWFKRTLDIGIRDVIFLNLYADFLLDQNRPGDVVALLKNEARVDVLLVRLAIAEKRLGMPELKNHLEILRQRFIANELRGDIRQSREEARFAFELQGNASEGLRLAKLNWEIQREPEDAVILYEAALAARDRPSVQLIQDWIKKSGLRDIRLKKLDKQARQVLP